MDKKSEHKWKLKQLKLKTAVFFRKNGIYVMAIGCLAVVGTAAALIFTGKKGKTPDVPVEHSGDQTLDDVMTPRPVATMAPTPVPTPSRRPFPQNTPYIPYIPDIPELPDFTVEPEPTAIPGTGISIEPPVDGDIIRVFAVNSLIYSETLQQWMTHSGVDIASPKDTEVRVILDGTVENVYTDDMMGVTVVIEHANGMKSVYANLKTEPPVNIGDKVKCRDVIGYIGDTAICECAEESHLHFEIHINGQPTDPESLIIFRKGNE